MPESPQLVDAVKVLTVAVGELSERLDTQQKALVTQQKVIDDLERQRKGLHSTRLVLMAAIFGIVLDLALTLGFGYLYQELDKVQRRTDTQILCPLYEFLALSLKVNPAQPTASPEQVELRHNAAVTIAAGLDTLGCA